MAEPQCACGHSEVEGRHGHLWCGPLPPSIAKAIATMATKEASQR